MRSKINSVIDANLRRTQIKFDSNCSKTFVKLVEYLIRIFDVRVTPGELPVRSRRQVACSKVKIAGRRQGRAAPRPTGRVHVGKVEIASPGRSAGVPLRETPMVVLEIFLMIKPETVATCPVSDQQSPAPETETAARGRRGCPLERKGK